MSESIDLIIRFAFNLSAVSFLLFGLYYPRYSHKETTMSAALLNIFAFAVLSVLSSVQFSVAAGFGLFAILALFTLRSEQVNVTDMAYFFGAISVAVITSIQGTQLGFVLLMLGIILLAVYVIDHPRVLRTANRMKITLDTIPANLASDPEALKATFSERLGVDVINVRIISINYVTEVVRAEVNYLVR